MLPEPIDLTNRISISWIRLPIKAIVLYMATLLNLGTLELVLVILTLVLTEIIDYFANRISQKHPIHRAPITLLVGLVNLAISFLLLIITNLQFSDIYLLIYVILITIILPTGIFGGLLYGLIAAFLYMIVTFRQLDQFVMSFHATIFLLIGFITGIIAEANRRNQIILNSFREQVSHQKEADNLKNDFLAIAYHTLRTPLTEIKGFHYLLTEPNDEPSRKNILEKMGVSLNKIQTIVDNILRIVEFESNTAQLKYEGIDIPQLLNNILNELQPLSKSKQVSTNLILDQTLGQNPIEFDLNKVEIAIKNIIDNAIRYSPSNSVVEITVKESSGNLTIIIKDQGKGIASEQMPYIFEKFHRADVLTPDNNEGLGVGLYLANRIIQQHNGKIDVVSETGTGTTVTVFLPKQTSGAFMDKF